MMAPAKMISYRPMDWGLHFGAEKQLHYKMTACSFHVSTFAVRVSHEHNHPSVLQLVHFPLVLLT